MSLDRSGIFAGSSTSSGFVASAIRFFEGAPRNGPSHSFILRWWPGDAKTPPGWQTCGMDENGWDKQPLADFVNSGEEIVSLRAFPGYDLAAGIAKVNLDGTSYDWAGLVGMMPVELWHTVSGHFGRNFLTEARHCFCSVGVRKILESAGVPLGMGLIPLSSTDPFTLEKFEALVPGALDINPLPYLNEAFGITVVQQSGST